MLLAQKEEQLAQTLLPLRDSQARFTWLVDQARKKPLMDFALRVEANRVEGCLARLWLVGEFREGRCHFQSESDSLIVKAVSGLLCEFYSGQTPVEILQYPPEFLGKLGINQHLSANRRNGLSRVWEKIRTFAAAHAPTEAGARASGEPRPG